MSNSLSLQELEDIFIQDKSEIYTEDEMFTLKQTKHTNKDLFNELMWGHISDLIDQDIIGYNSDIRKYWVK